MPLEIQTNIAKEIYRHYLDLLHPIYGATEATSLLRLIFDDLAGIPRHKIMADNEIRLSESEILKIHFACKELLQFRPLQYILGKTFFYGMEIKVGEGVLIPRPETEELLDWVLGDYQKDIGPIRILDVCCGSGCIGLGIKKHRPDFEITLSDISWTAEKYTNINAEFNRCSIQFQHSDVLNQESLESLGSFDIVVSNPPYVLESEKRLMSRNVLDFEPEIALFVPDEDPLKFYKAIVQIEASVYYFEINEAMGEKLIRYFNELGYNTTLKKDLNEKDRMLKVSKM